MKMVYVAHPFSGRPENVQRVQEIMALKWDLLLDALRKWTDERRPRDEGKEESE